MERKIIRTEDGSSSIFVPGLNEHYHSTKGAVQESMHVFIKAGLKHLDKSDLSVFEMGFGTGLNAILTYLHKSNKRISYHSIEAYPLTTEELNELNYTDFLQTSDTQTLVLENILQQEFNTIQDVSDNFRLHKESCKLSSFTPTKMYDIVYFDAFAPDIQPDLWDESVFQKMYSCLNKNGILVTYCAKGQVRRNMISSGFEVERLPGPPGKREILRATKLS
ncbi:MAG: tRNA (5-methylaminomethyl-2-thiouridine)(34)-methyltransferase MnmD [Bacteroidales bacterium]|nr:tRNA (5-methylaminomethyl-2-thiouridine)(34)-methyltransferase MnmD [Bacteroidales bacterium]